MIFSSPVWWRLCCSACLPPLGLCAGAAVSGGWTEWAAGPAAGWSWPGCSAPGGCPAPAASSAGRPTTGAPSAAAARGRGRGRCLWGRTCPGPPLWKRREQIRGTRVCEVSYGGMWLSPRQKGEVGEVDVGVVLSGSGLRTSVSSDSTISRPGSVVEVVDTSWGLRMNDSEPPAPVQQHKLWTSVWYIVSEPDTDVHHKQASGRLPALYTQTCTNNHKTRCCSSIFSRVPGSDTANLPSSCLIL